MAATAPLLRMAPDWTPSTSPLPVLRAVGGRHRAPGGRLDRLAQRAGAAVRTHALAAIVLAVVRFSGPERPA